MKPIVRSLFLLFISSQAPLLLAQAFVGPPPWFSLTISEKQLPAGYPPVTHAIEVKYTNISKSIQVDNCAVTVGIYSIKVKHDGRPVEMKRVKRHVDEKTSGSTRHEVQIPDTGAVTCGHLNRGIKPGESVEFPIWVSALFDMREPGRYEITVTRKVTLPSNPRKTVAVMRSNTLALIVPVSSVQ